MSTNALAATSETTHSQEEIYAIMTAFAEAIDTMLADQTLWVVPKKSDGTLDTVAYPAFIETLFGRIASEAERTSIKTV